MLSEKSDWFLTDGPLRLGLGVHDGLSARVADKYNFAFVWVSSYGASASLGLPDFGLLDLFKMASVVRTVARNTRHLVVVDMDSGYGGLRKVKLGAQLISRSGASAVCIEDNPLDKRSSLYPGKRVLASVEEHEKRLRAARCGLAPGCLLIARTEALVAGLGVAEALDRANRYVDAGADTVFVQATKPDGGRELLEFAQRWGRRTPVFIAPTCYPALGVEHYTRAGITHWIFANQLLRASYRAMDDVARQIEKAKTGPAPQLEDQIASVQEIAIALGAYEDEELED